MKILRKIGAVIMVSLLIATTGGFSIYSHICYCLEKSSTSVFHKATCEHERSMKNSSCCKVERTPSCCANKPFDETKTTVHKDNCCRNSGHFLKISDLFQPGVEKVTLNTFAVASSFFLLESSINENTEGSLIPHLADLPPPDSGRKILLAHHQLKLDPSLV
jgi:hypothetical protein